jgi:epoxyqueuosine reductase
VNRDRAERHGVTQAASSDDPSAPMARSIELKQRAQALGFDALGIAPLEPNPHADAIERWLRAGYAGQMTYLHRQADRRKDPRTIMPNATVALVTLTNYNHDAPTREGDAARGRVAQYAWSADYHGVIGPRLERLAAAIGELVPGARTRVYVDAGPVPERELAQRAGLGWIGKNTMLINPRLGSFTFIGVVLTDAALAVDAPFEADRCGTCRACLEACPTAAFVQPREMDARRCISYLTIEHRGPFSAREASWLGEWVFGCDVCQDVCPWNVRFARATLDPDFAAREDLVWPRLDALCALDPASFDARYGETPFERPGIAGIRRNAAAVASNGTRP